jgi:hypothetical protein
MLDQPLKRIEKHPSGVEMDGPGNPFYVGATEPGQLTNRFKE